MILALRGGAGSRVLPGGAKRGCHAIPVCLLITVLNKVTNAGSTGVCASRILPAQQLCNPL